MNKKTFLISFEYKKDYLYKSIEKIIICSKNEKGALKILKDKLKKKGITRFEIIDIEEIENKQNKTQGQLF